MNRCVRCWMPDTRPGSVFDEKGVCLACHNYDKRKDVDWEARKRRLIEHCYDARIAAKQENAPYDCVIPVSGGKDSHRLVKILTELEMKPLLVTVTDPFTHTKAGTENLRNLITISGAQHWQYTINHDLFLRATRAAFEDRGEPLKFVEYAIYTIPVMLAHAMRIPLVVFGENSAYEYGSSTFDDWDAKTAISPMRKALLEDDGEWWRQHMKESELRSIVPPTANDLYPKVMYMSYFVPWSSLTNRHIAKTMGFQDLDDTGEWKREGTMEQFEQIDSVAYMFHLWMKYPKFGFQRVSDIASRRVREGYLKLSEAKELIREHDHRLDPWAREDFRKFCGYSEDELSAIIAKWTTYEAPI